MYAVALQISIQPLGKLLVLARIAKKAGGVLDRVTLQSTHRDDEVLWNTGSAQKNLRNLACGAVDGINAKRRWIAMLHRLKPLHRTEINVIELSPSYFCAADLNVPEVRTTEIRATQNRLAEISRLQAGATGIGVAQIGIPEVSTPQVRAQRSVPCRSAPRRSL